MGREKNEYGISVAESQTFLLAKRPSATMSEEKRLPFAGYAHQNVMQRSKMICRVAMPKKSRKRTKNLYDIEIVQVDKERKRFKIHFVRLGLEINSTSGVISVPAVDSFRLSAWRKVLSPAKNH